MAKEYNRTDRLADAVQRILAKMLQFEVRDPRIGMVNINDVEVSRDLSFARVFVTLVDREDQADIDEAMKALNKATGFLRTKLAKELDTRIVPKLSFMYDKTSVDGQNLSHLIDRAVAEDRSHGNASVDPEDIE
jgi:ribosome-binding factor A